MPVWLCTIQDPHSSRRLVQYVQAPTAQDASMLLRHAGMVERGHPVQAYQAP